VHPCVLASQIVNVIVTLLIFDLYISPNFDTSEVYRSSNDVRLLTECRYVGSRDCNLYWHYMYTLHTPPLNFIPALGGFHCDSMAFLFSQQQQ